MLSAACPRCGLALADQAAVCPACALAVAAGGPAGAPPRPDAPGPTWPGPTPPPDAGALAPPGYELIAELGRGGMGVVYLARQVALRREVALKMVLSGAHAGAAERSRFRTEAEALARLQHPGIVAIYEVGEHAGRPFLCMELCPGGSLERRLGGSPLIPREAAGLVQALALAVQAAHEARVIHRDLKPANVLFASDGAPKVTDFGLARMLDEVSQTQTGAALGTPSYMAPEQAEGRKDVEPAADVYSLGAILYECLTGRPPFRAATMLDTILQVTTQEPVPPSSLNAQVPRDLQTVCLACLRKEPGRRYGSAQALADDLGRWLRGDPIAARPVGRVERAAKWVRRNPVVAALSGAIALVLVAGMVVSGLFALEARREAARANDKAEEAERERVTAEREKAKAQEALAEVEKTLIEGLLRPIGKEGDGLSQTEVEALRQLEGLSDDQRVRFVEIALRRPETARRVGRRPEWVVRAAAGLDRSRRDRVTRLILGRLAEPGLPKEVEVACVLLGAQLEVRDSDFLLRGVKALAPFVGSERVGDWYLSHNGLSRLVGQLSREEATGVVEALLDLLKQANSPVKTHLVANELSDLLTRLPPGPAARLAIRAADEVIGRLVKEKHPGDQTHLLFALLELLERLPASDRARLADRATMGLSGSLASPQAGERHSGWYSGYRELSGVMSRGQLRQVADAAAAAANKAPAGELSELAYLLADVAARLPPAEGARYRLRAVMSLARAIEGEVRPARLPSLSEALGRVGDAAHAAIIETAARRLLRELQKAPGYDEVKALADSLARLLAKVERAEAAHLAGLATEHVRAALRRAHPSAFSSLAASLAQLSGWLDQAGARLTAEALLSAMPHCTNGHILRDVANAVPPACKPLRPGEAARYAARAAEAVLAAMQQGPSSYELSSLGVSLAALRPPLGPAGGHYARAGARALLRALSEQSGVGPVLADAVASLVDSLEGAEAAAAGEALLKALSQQRAGKDTATLAEPLLRLHQRLPPHEAAKQAVRTSVTLAAKFAEVDDINDISHLLEALERLRAGLPPAEANRACRDVLRSLPIGLARLANWDSDAYATHLLGGPSAGLTRLYARVETGELVRLLGQPHRGARLAALAALGQRARMTFRSPYHFLDWAEASGVDLWPAAR